MKILHINSNDINGGAARSAYRLHQALLKMSIDSKFLVQTKHLTDGALFTPIGKMDRGLTLFNSKMDTLLFSLFRVRSTSIWSMNLGFVHYMKKIIEQYGADIVHLHWINQGFFPLGLLKEIPTPIVWTLHDSWAFTAGCHLPYECEKYINQCHECRQLEGKKWLDFSKINFERKKKIFQETNLHVVSPSQWLYECASKSTLLKDKNIYLIPNGLDLQLYKPLSKKIARELLRISPNKKMILFGAMNAVNDLNKGFQYLWEALKLLKLSCKDESIEIVIFGSREPIDPPDFGFKTTYMGRLFDDISLRALYSAADVMIVPSKSENLPNTIMEALSCGTPCVAFNVGGNKDLITHKENGYLAQAYDSSDLSNGIAYVLQEESNWNRLSTNARNSMCEKVEMNKVAEKYFSLYEEILK